VIAPRAPTRQNAAARAWQSTCSARPRTNKEISMNGIVRGFAAVLVIASACMTVPEDGESAPGPQTGQTTQALMGIHKMCSAVVPDKYRDTIIVDDTWTASTCFSWARSVNVGIGTWQLGCLLPGAFTWGAPGGGPPTPSNCGW
jgi:hypothetical protein